MGGRDHIVLHQVERGRAERLLVEEEVDAGDAALAEGRRQHLTDPGGVREPLLEPAEGQRALAARRPEARFEYVFHGGSGSDPAAVAAAIANGVVKVNVDTDAQYAFTRPVAGHMLRHYDGVLRVDGGVGDKRAYDPRAWGGLAEAGMAAAVAAACRLTGSAGRTKGGARPTAPGAAAEHHP